MMCWDCVSENKLSLVCNLITQFNLPLIGSFYMTHAARALQSHDCRGRELNCGSQTYFFDHTRTGRASPDEWSARCRGHLRDSTNMKDNTHQAHTQSSQQGEYGMMTTAKWYSGTLAPKVSRHLSYRWGKTPKKIHPGNLSRPGIEPGPAAITRCIMCLWNLISHTERGHCDTHTD